MPDPSDPQSTSPSRWIAWAQLVRLPNVFTILADVAAAFLLVAGGPSPLPRFVCVVLAGVALYWAGMILNDVFDAQRDREERATRPIPAGWITHAAARRAGAAMLVTGVGLAALSGWLPSANVSATWIPAGVGVALAAMIVAYDGPLKKTPLAPAAMGGCRVLSFLLGASPALAASDTLFPKYLVCIALGFGVYIMGITTMARREAIGSTSIHLSSGLVVTIIGVAMLAFSPQLAEQGRSWHVSPPWAFPVLIAVIAFPVIIRAFRAAIAPSPVTIQATIRVGILTMIPLAASFAMLGAGPAWGLAIFSLVAPAITLSLRFRVT